MREVLVAEPLDRVSVRQQDERAELVARACEQRLVQIGERNEEIDAVLVDDAPQRPYVLRIVDARHEDVAVGVVERRRQRVDVRGDRRRACAAKGTDDVDALARAREEDRGHAVEPSQ